MIRYNIKHSPIKWTSRHVKGHQDDAKRFGDLNEWGQMNVLADQLAKEELRRNHPVLQGPLMAGQAWRFRCGEVEIAGDAKRQIRTALHEPTMQQRWKTQFGVNESDEEFDWFAKHNARIGSVRTNLVQGKHSKDPTCPCCGELEMTDHIYQCKSTTMQVAYDVNIAELRDHLRATTSKAITEKFLKSAAQREKDRTAKLMTTGT